MKSIDSKISVYINYVNLSHGNVLSSHRHKTSWSWDVLHTIHSVSIAIREEHRTVKLIPTNYVTNIPITTGTVSSCEDEVRTQSHASV